MAIIPSGKRKFMKLQQQYQVTDQEGDATQAEVTDDQGAGGNGPFNFNQLKQDMAGQKNKSVAGPHFGEEDYQAAAKGGGLDKNMPEEEAGAAMGGAAGQPADELGKKGANIRGYVFQLLEELGAPPRLILENPDTFFQGKKDLDTGTISGSYILPSYTKNKKVTQQEAESIAMKIGEQFGLSQSISPQGSNFKIDFRTKEVQMQEDHGTSLQELVKNRGAAKPGGQASMGKAASSKSGMIKIDRNELYQKLTQKGLEKDNG